MYKKTDKFPDTKVYNYVMGELARRNVSIDDIVDIAMDLQAKYNPGIPREHYIKVANNILHKREILNYAMTGFSLDNAAEKNALPEPLLTIIKGDYSLYGADEILALGMINLYGSIGITNYGYVDKVKKGIIKKLDTTEEHVNTFADDIVGALAVAVGTKVSQDNG